MKKWLLGFGLALVVGVSRVSFAADSAPRSFTVVPSSIENPLSLNSENTSVALLGYSCGDYGWTCPCYVYGVTSGNVCNAIYCSGMVDVVDDNYCRN